MATTYSYDIATDFPATGLNNIQFKAEIESSAIVTALQGITVLSSQSPSNNIYTIGTVNITFKVALSPGEKTILDGNTTGPAGGLIAAHVATTICKTEPITIPRDAKDAFGRLKVSNPSTQFDSKLFTSNDPTQFSELTSGSGVITYTSNQPHTELSVDGNVAGRCVRQSRRYVPYQPGKSLQFLITGTLMLDSSVVGTVARIGAFDNKSDKTVDVITTGDGFFFQLEGGVTPALSLVYRSSNNATYTQNDTIVSQSVWNGDRLDGTGPSGIVFDPTIRQIFWFEKEWLGTGQVSAGVVIDGQFILCHAFNFANTTLGTPATLASVAYTTRGSVPIRYELESLGTGAATTVTMHQVCSTGISDGGFTPRGKVYAASRGTSLVGVVTVEVPLISIRLRASRNRGNLNPIDMTIMTTSAGNMRFAVYRFFSPAGAGPLTGASWVDETTDTSLYDSMCEYDISATAVDLTGVTYRYKKVVDQYYSNNVDLSLASLDNRLVATADIAGNVDIIVVTAQRVGGGGTETTVAGIQWQEWE